MRAPKVAVVDDERDVVAYMSTLLLDAGYEVCSAGNASDGLAIIESERPDLLCLDLVMPGQTGLTLYREIRSSPQLKDLPVLIVTGLSPAGEIASLLSGLPPADGYIEKPLDSARFLAEVGRLARLRMAG
jgi:CheY-like chemotaxis protein